MISKLYVFETDSLDPYHNLAMEEYLLDTLLEGDISDRAFLISEYGKKVQEIEKRIRRINENAAGNDRESYEGGKGNRKKSEWIR